MGNGASGHQDTLVTSRSYKAPLPSLPDLTPADAEGARISIARAIRRKSHRIGAGFFANRAACTAVVLSARVSTGNGADAC